MSNYIKYRPRNVRVFLVGEVTVDTGFVSVVNCGTSGTLAKGSSCVVLTKQSMLLVKRCHRLLLYLLHHLCHQNLMNLRIRFFFALGPEPFVLMYTYFRRNCVLFPDSFSTFHRYSHSSLFWCLRFYKAIPFSFVSYKYFLEWKPVQ